MVIVHVRDRAHGFLIRLPFFSNQRLPDEVPQGFRPIRVSSAKHEMIEIVE